MRAGEFMLIDYVHAAMRRAKYELLGGGEGFVGRIQGFPGLIAHARTLERCRDDLYGAIQSWLLLKLRHGDRDIPVIDGINLTTGKTGRPRRSPSRSPKKAA